ncbi:hypothetical protein RvY_01506 [Ramazzottius varieornatus]|uniref:SID1 transmembrane family member 1 n=1 Tax=Ramazzottius varieornatus TaxID=947166 RepID=A0A1D1URT6_RAMVA|nr:hypothetical protein RvY_01506 [Ramazzottius varieornatus]
MKILIEVALLLSGLLCTNGEDLSQEFPALPTMDWPTVQQSFHSSFNRTYSQIVSSGHAAVFGYRQSTKSGAVKVQVWSSGAKVANPILVVVKRHNSVLSWQVPLVLEDAYSYLVTNRTLCPMRNHFLPAAEDDSPEQVPVPEVENFFVEVLTLSTQPIDFSLRVEPYHTFIKDGDISFIMEASPSAPHYVQYNMRTDSVRVLVKLDAIEGKSFCGYFSLQSVHCPVGDMESELRLEGRFQTVTSKSAIEVHRDHFKESQFYIVLLVHPHDDCEDAGSTFLGPFRPRRPSTDKNVETSERRKVVSITVTDTVDSDTIIIAVAVPIIVYLAFSLLIVILLQTTFSNWIAILCWKTILCRKVLVIKLPNRETQWKLNYFCDHNLNGAELPSQWDVKNYKKKDDSIVSVTEARAMTATEDKNIPDSETKVPLLLPVRHTYHFDTLHGKSSKIQGDRPAATRSISSQALHLEGLVSGEQAAPTRSTETGRSTSAKTDIVKSGKSVAVEYGTTLIAVFVFYALPVLQLVLTHQGLLLLTGNQDLCYYNFSCSNRLGVLSDFNHVVSNAGYVILGLLFILQVRRRSVFTSVIGDELLTKQIDIHDYGPPNQFGVLYGMGLALVMEGLMSSFYHICPSYSNFQFDTSFMYLISGLLILKLRHSRHRNILPRSYKAYSIFAIFIFIAVLGVVLRQYWYWIAFSIIHILLTLVIVHHTIFENDDDAKPQATADANPQNPLKGSPHGTKCKMFQREEWVKVPSSRYVIATLVLTVNMGFAVAGPILGGVDFASHLLFILQGNLFVYAVFYLVKKRLSENEKLSIGSLIYFLLAQPAWIAGMYFFVAGLTDWKVSPAISREGNKDCFLYNFYDEHDVWHMLSAFGLYFTFMFLLTLDDDIATLHKDDLEKF